MITEIAIFQAAPGKADAFAEGIQRGAAVIRRDPRCHALSIYRSIEDPARFVLQIQWESIEAHTEGFRKSPLFAEYRSHINDLFLDNPVVHHYQTLMDSDK